MRVASRLNHDSPRRAATQASATSGRPRRAVEASAGGNVAPAVTTALPMTAFVLRAKISVATPSATYPSPEVPCPRNSRGVGMLPAEALDDS